MKQAGDPFEKILPVFIILENSPLIDSSYEDMVWGAGCSHTGFENFYDQFFRDGFVLVFSDASTGVDGFDGIHVFSCRDLCNYGNYSSPFQNSELVANKDVGVRARTFKMRIYLFDPAAQ